MSWCGKCFTGQPESDFDSDDDGEYEYFVNSNYICKRKKTNFALDGGSTLQGNTESTAESTITSESEVSSSSTQNPKSSLRCRTISRPSCSKTDNTSHTSSCDTDKKSSIDAAQMAGARVWQVGHATISGPSAPYDPFHKPIQPLCVPSTSGSDQTTEIVFKQSSQQDSPKTVLTPSLSRQDKTVVNQTSLTPPSTDNSRKGHSSSQVSNSGKCRKTSKTSKQQISFRGTYPLFKESAFQVLELIKHQLEYPSDRLTNRPGIIQRLFGRSGKSVFSRKSRGGASQPSGFKESMEQTSPAIATNTLYWTVRVKMK